MGMEDKCDWRFLSLYLAAGRASMDDARPGRALGFARAKCSIRVGLVAAKSCVGTGGTAVLTGTRLLPTRPGALVLGST
jgi:hypothetical protein